MRAFLQLRPADHDRGPAIRERDPDVPVLILTALSEAEYAVGTLKAGANGYITKQNASDELKLAIHKVMAGESYLTSEAIARVIVPFVPGWSARVRVGETNNDIVLGLPAVRLPVFLPVQNRTAGEE